MPSLDKESTPDFGEFLILLVCAPRGPPQTVPSTFSQWFSPCVDFLYQLSVFSKVLLQLYPGSLHCLKQSSIKGSGNGSAAKTMNIEAHVDCPVVRAHLQDLPPYKDPTKAQLYLDKVLFCQLSCVERCRETSLKFSAGWRLYLWEGVWLSLELGLGLK